MVSTNRLSTEKRAQIIGCLVEGNSIRATIRMTGASKNTITKLLVDLGQACADYQDIALRDLPCTTLECDQIWAYCYAKLKNVPDEHRGTFGYGDIWTWTALCADTKLVPSWLIGERNASDAWMFLTDLKGRLANRVQLSTDGHKAYVSAIPLSFGGHVDWGVIQKLYGPDPSSERRYSPPVCTGSKIKSVKGNPDPSRISTSYVERQNFTMRMGMRRFTRLTNAFSKKVENLAHAVSLHYMHYNFARVHSSLTITDSDGKSIKRTPAMAAGVSDHVWSLREIAGLQRERDPAAKCQLPALIFERVWLDEQRIVAVQPKGAICALLQHPDAPARLQVRRQVGPEREGLGAGSSRRSPRAAPPQG
jgi:IS1 family transposase